MSKSVDSDIRQAKQQLEKLHDLLEQGVYDVNTFSERRKQLLARIDTLTASRASLVPPKQLNTEAMRKRITEVMEVYPTVDPNTQNQLLKTIVEKITYTKRPGAQPSDFHLEVFLNPIYF